MPFSICSNTATTRKFSRAILVQSAIGGGISGGVYAVTTDDFRGGDLLEQWIVSFTGIEVIIVRRDAGN